MSKKWEFSDKILLQEEPYRPLIALTLRINVIFYCNCPCNTSWWGPTAVRQSPETFPLNRTYDFDFRYEGSLTTPGCVEAVIWTIFKEPLVINAKTRDSILKTDSTRKVNNNFRTLMPVNDREGMVCHMKHSVWCIDRAKYWDM